MSSYQDWNTENFVTWLDNQIRDKPMRDGAETSFSTLGPGVPIRVTQLDVENEPDCYFEVTVRRVQGKFPWTMPDDWRGYV